MKLSNQRTILNFASQGRLWPQGAKLSPTSELCPVGVKLSPGVEIPCLPLHSSKQ
jgi:hypothetical protein